MCACEVASDRASKRVFVFMCVSRESVFERAPARVRARVRTRTHQTVCVQHTQRLNVVM